MPAPADAHRPAPRTPPTPLARALATPHRRRRPVRSAWRVVLHTLLILFAVAQLFPLIWVAVYSLQKSGDLFGSELLKLPLHPQWDNYVRAFRDGKVLRYAANSLVVVSISTVVST